jgi:hypothetical protein
LDAYGRIFTPIKAGTKESAISIKLFNITV